MRFKTLTAICICFTICIPVASFANTPFEASEKLIAAGQITEARRALETELRIRPENLTARYNLAILLERIGDTGLASRLYRKNLSYSWHLPSLVNLSHILRSTNKTEQAKSLLAQASNKMKHESVPWYLLAEIADQSDNKQLAAQLHQQSIKADPLNGFAYLRYADFQSRHELSDLGIKYGKKALLKLKTCSPCWSKYGDILSRANKQSDALDAYQHSIAINPNTVTRQKIIDTLRKLGKNRRADQMQQGLSLFQ